MRSKLALLRTLPFAAGLIVAAAPAFAGDPYGERYHADTFGNLIVYSPAGYKRIIVGQGHVLAEYEAQAAVDGLTKADRVPDAAELAAIETAAAPLLDLLARTGLAPTTGEDNG